MLGSGSARRTVTVYGLGGIGKTQLAIAYAKRHRDDYSAVFWLNAKDETTLKQGFVTLAERISREHPYIVYLADAIQSHRLDASIRAVKRWLDQAKNSGWLIIYDNYDNPAFGGVPPVDIDEADGDMNSVSQSYDIRPYFPDTHHGAILMTTRSAKVKIGRQVALGKLKELKDSLEILARTSNRQDLQSGM